MKHLLSLLVLFGTALTAHADQFYKLVGYKCVPEADRLVVFYRGAYNEKGKQLISAKGPNEWDPWSLVDVTAGKDETRVAAIRHVERDCRLSSGTYHVDIYPAPNNPNILGHCGTDMGAGVSITKGETSIIRTFFESDCDLDDPVLTEVEIRGRSRSPRIKSVPKDSFYQ